MNYRTATKAWQPTMEAQWRYNYSHWTFPFEINEDGWISVAGHEIYKEREGVDNQQGVDEVVACIMARADGSPELVMMEGEPSLGELKTAFLAVKVDK